MKKGYNEFVFDVENRVFLGDFEKMYQNEIAVGNEAWQSSQWATRDLKNDILLKILEQYN